MTDYNVPEYLLHATDISWTREFNPKPQPIVPLTVTQIAIPLLVSSLTFILATTLFFTLTIDTFYLKVALISALGFSFNSVIFIIVAEYIFVSRWVSNIMDRQSRYLRNTSFEVLANIMNTRLRCMCGLGVLCSVLGATSMIVAVTIFAKIWWLWAIITPAISFCTVELFISELC